MIRSIGKAEPLPVMSALNLHDVSQSRSPGTQRAQDCFCRASMGWLMVPAMMDDKRIC
jgi:hypothetical protein